MIASRHIGISHGYSTDILRKNFEIEYFENIFIFRVSLLDHPCHSFKNEEGYFEIEVIFIL